MGQRLVVTIKNGDRRLCNIYYHWGAYTYRALYQTKKIVDCIYNHADESEKELLLRLIHFCEENGGGIANGFGSEEWKYIQKLYPNETFKKSGISRNDGLIALSEKGMAESQSWSEGDVIIDLDKYQINNGVYAGYEFLEEYNECRAEWDDDFEELTLEDIPDIGYDLGYIDIDDIDAVIAALREVDGVCRYGNEIYELTE